MSYTIGVIAFVVALLLSVMLHEAGHFATAKAFGMKASRFFVGFGPTIWSFQRGETEYGVKAIPAGGFVKIDGMTALEEIEPGDEDRAFYKQSAPQRTVVLIAGSFVHFIIAIVTIFGIIAATHVDPVKYVAQVQGVTSATAPAAGHLQSGDTLVAIDGHKINSDGTPVSTVVQRNVGKPVTIEVRRHGTLVTETVVPQAVKQGNKSVGRVGIEIEQAETRDSTAEAFPRTFATLWDYLKSTGSALKTLPSELSGIVQNKPRNPNGAASVVDIARVSGQVASTHSVSIGTRVSTLLQIVAELNLFVGIFNLLPLLPLDGGHVAILLFEEIRTRAYRLFGRRDPGRVDIMKVLPVTYFVVAVFVGLSLLLIYAGITNPIKLQ